jgi:hypothetical protein
MILLIIFSVAALAIIWLAYKFISKRRRLSAEELEEMRRIEIYMERPAKTLVVPLSECRLKTRKQYFSPPDSESDYLDSLVGKDAPRIETEWARAEYTGDYKGVPKKFISQEWPITPDILKTMPGLRLGEGTATIDIYEDDWGNLLEYVFNIEFLNV